MLADLITGIKIALVVPCYNEEPVLSRTAEGLLRELEQLVVAGKVATDSFVLFANDGSTDSTWRIIKDIAARTPRVKGVSLSRNRGHQNAWLAGLMEVKESCDAAISLDCDGQDDIAAIERMIDAHANGAEIVYGVRNSRATDTWMKRNCARGFYKLLYWLGAEVVYDHADYRLVSARVLRELSLYGEVNLFLRGMFPLLGFRTAEVRYDRRVRDAGESHYPLRKQLALAANGITSLSIKPIRIITALGMIVSLLSFLMICWCVISYVSGRTVPGWTSCVLVSSLLGGVQLVSLGVIGEYVGKTYMETKRRPRYIIAERI